MISASASTVHTESDCLPVFTFQLKRRRIRPADARRLTPIRDRGLSGVGQMVKLIIGCLLVGFLVTDDSVGL